MTPTLFAPILQILWKVIESHGHDPGPLFEDAGVDRNKLKDPEARVSIAAAGRIVDRAIELTGNPALGLRAAQYWHPSHAHALGYAMLASSTLRTALGRLARYSRVVTEAFTVRFDESGDDFTVELEFGENHVPPPWRGDGQLAVLLKICRMTYGEELDPTRATFIHSAPAGSGAYFAYFRSPVEFSAPQDSLCLPVGAVDKLLPTGNPHLAQLNDQVMIRYLGELNRRDVAQRVKVEIIDQLPSGRISDESVADTLHTSVRSLHRQLQARGTNFKALLEQTRRELAENYVRDSRISLTEVSFLLGFSEPSAFSRAFRRWTGDSPSRIRQAA